MDPQVAWNEMLEAIAIKDFFEAELRAEALIDWLDQSGFAPQTVSRLLPAEGRRLEPLRAICVFPARVVRGRGLFGRVVSGSLPSNLPLDLPCKRCF